MWRERKQLRKEARKLEKRQKSESELGMHVKPEEVSDDSSVVSAVANYSRDELKHEVMRRRIKSFNFVK